MKAHNLFVYTGYAEDASWSCICWHHDKGFDSVEEALVNISEIILNSITEVEANSWRPKCCRDLLGNNDKRFCKDCGRKLKGAGVNEEELSDFILKIRTGTNDTISYDLWEELEDKGWHLFCFSEFDSSHPIVINENGEHILSAAAFGKIEYSSSFNIPKRMKFYKDGRKIK